MPAWPWPRASRTAPYFGPLQLVQRLAPTLAKERGRRGGQHRLGRRPDQLPVYPTYSASKAAFHSLTQAGRALLGGQGTSVFGVYPGPVDTDMAREVALDKTPPRDVAQAILDGIEAGEADIFPDPFAVDFGREFEASPKSSERRIAAMVSSPAA